MIINKKGGILNFREFRAGTYIKQYKYSSFLPSKINHDWVWDDPYINVLMENATKSLGELNAFSIIVPDVDLFIQMHIIKEANTSSRIEGTQTNINEALMDKKAIVPERRDDWQEVQNYINAMNYSIKKLEKIPLTSRLLKQAHAVLMEGVRGKHKTPGEFRRSQNWIGGSNLSDAVFIPPNFSEISELMGDLEKFWHNQNINVPHLIKVSISHYQFETIHPFLDGNGRIGRLLITLYLVSMKLLYKPTLYLSDFFEKNRSSYYDALSIVRTSNNISHWVKFFLNGIITTSEKGKETFKEILNLKNNAENKIMNFGRRAIKAKNLLELLYRKPIVSIKEVEKFLKISNRPAREIVSSLEKAGILVEFTGKKRSRLFSFRDYLKLFLE